MAFGLALTGCASQASKNTGDKQQGAEDDPLTRKDGEDVEKAEGCAAGGSGLWLARAGSQPFKGDTVTVYTDRSKKKVTLCEALLKTRKKVAIFQFAGVECISCQDESKELQEKIKSSPYGKDIAHIVILTDFFKDYKDEQFKGFLDEYAPGDPAYYDEAALWKSLSKNPAAPDRATIFAMDVNMNGYLLNETGKGGIQIWEHAEEMAKGLSKSSTKTNTKTSTSGGTKP